mmetsp:Transcript_11145/g.19042  ORF Transcript_11145/g.19042 Transcript_11145/m.19042 type:complete len:304 (-) Transcript_11145:16-927(-)
MISNVGPRARQSLYHIFRTTSKPGVFSLPANDGYLYQLYQRPHQHLALVFSREISTTRYKSEREQEFHIERSHSIVEDYFSKLRAQAKERQRKKNEEAMVKYGKPIDPKTVNMVREKVLKAGTVPQAQAQTQARNPTLSSASLSSSSPLSTSGAPAARNGGGDSPPPTEEKLTKTELMKRLMKNYGVGFLIYWTAVWAASGVGIYGLISYLGPEASLNMLRDLGVDQYIPGLTPSAPAPVDPALVESIDGQPQPASSKGVDPRLVNVGVAVAINEVAELIRFPIVVATTPKVVSFFRRKKPVP